MDWSESLKYLRLGPQSSLTTAQYLTLEPAELLKPLRIDLR